MTNRHVLGFVTIAAGILGVVGLLKITAVRVAGQTRTAGATVMTSWSEPDLQGIWYQTYNVPLQRAPRNADKGALTEAERKAQDEARVKVIGRDKRSDVGTERDVAGAYNAVFSPPRLPAGERTSLIIEPKDGRLPSLTPAAQKEADLERDYRLA